jgi:hypothetical protein
LSINIDVFWDQASAEARRPTKVARINIESFFGCWASFGTIPSADRQGLDSQDIFIHQGSGTGRGFVEICNKLQGLA